jgi:putative MATE family efflux protein
MRFFRQIDLSKGTPWKVILLFSLPIIFGNFLAQIYSIADGYMVGRYVSEDAFAAISLSGNIMYLGTASLTGLAAGMSGFTAQLFGAKDYQGLRKSYATSLFLGVIITLVLSLLLLGLLDPILLLAKVEVGSNVYQLSKLYLMVIFAGLIGTFLFNLYLNFLRAIGDSFVPLFLLIIYSFLNMGLDYLFIVVLRMGVLGAGLSYDIALLLSGLTGTVWVYIKYPRLHLQWKDFSFEKNFFLSHLKMGLPMAGLFLLIGFSVLIMQGGIDQFGSEAINGYSSASRLENLLCVFISSLGSALEAYCGVNYGAKQYHRLKIGVTQSVIIMGIDLLLKIGISLIVMDKAADFFLSAPSETTKAYCRMYIYWDLATYLFLGLIYVFRNALLGLGKSWPPFFSGMAEFVGRSVMSLAIVIPLGAVAAFGSPGIAWVLSGTLLMVWGIVTVYRNPKFNHDEILPETSREEKHRSLQ